ncbi:pyridoxine-5-phosphate oxidase [Holotrichia oblita]|uniref:Pyridoxine-5-phosphate oxidase n=2 Tax=Holotrichia oblita TaxID=644536 RepID=A0ACB9T464_HOLOL|nr:pyridoxine-5-phosphate oxidase [Holotrichia oblita]KAI4461567.1 pyridoxine-5-phosphate oxidase [Holotrichia oblita]
MSILGIRISYNDRSNLLLEENITVKEPFNLFSKWYQDAVNNPSIIEPNAACLATATKEGIPSARFVLCKGYDSNGFKFFTHYTSRKGQEIVRIEGVASKLPFSDADEYFHSRPYQSQIGALCSDQSKPIEGRHILWQREVELKQQYSEGNVPRPEQWGGYNITPKSIEFWQGQTDRIHDRIKFRRPKEGEIVDNKYCFVGENNWIYERLCP